MASIHDLVVFITGIIFYSCWARKPIIILQSLSIIVDILLFVIIQYSSCTQTVYLKYLLALLAKIAASLQVLLKRYWKMKSCNFFIWIVSCNFVFCTWKPRSLSSFFSRKNTWSQCRALEVRITRFWRETGEAKNSFRTNIHTLINYSLSKSPEVVLWATTNPRPS